MYKKLRAYTAYIEEEAKNPSQKLIDYHKTMVEQFQHERLIHLIVTLFFALFMILFFGLFCFLEVDGARGNNILNICVGGVTALLLVTMVCYAIHYYHLENGVQKLEEITKKLYR
ncbi:hypothetical protein IK110_00255 [Candidatus Saccharibacteria bacterium]|nr:hypothetical protein [Candidatus Saccharibacteria bacterium]